MRFGTALTATLAAVLVLTSCGEESTPESTVRDYYDFLASGGSTIRLAELFVPEVDILRTRLEPISIENLVVDTVHATSDSASVTAEYDTDFPENAHVKATITLVKRGQRWLISELTQEKAGE